MSHQVDARGLSCPQPVLLTLQAIQSASGKEDICILVDNQTSFEKCYPRSYRKGMDRLRDKPG